jgi:hypothetical protein
VPDDAEREWCALSARVRAHLAERAAALPEMGVGQLRAFVEACREAQAFEVEARTHDLAVEEHRARLERRAAYGG